MSGYFTYEGYMGYVNGAYMLFASETDYLDYMEAQVWKGEFKMKTFYITITGTNHHYGMEFIEKGMSVKLVKEPDNEYDKEAIGRL